MAEVTGGTAGAADAVELLLPRGAGPTVDFWAPNAAAPRATPNAKEARPAPSNRPEGATFGGAWGLLRATTGGCSGPGGETGCGCNHGASGAMGTFFVLGRSEVVGDGAGSTAGGPGGAVGEVVATGLIAG